MWTTTQYTTTKTTIELRDLVDNSVELWNFDYPSFYEGDEKKAFEQKVIDHYYFRQIGFETPGKFLFKFRSKIREIMPYYIQMYNTVKIMDELPSPFDNVDVTETISETITNTGNSSELATANASMTSETSGSSEGSENKEHRYSDTPQGSISNIDSYMSEASKDKNTSESSSESSYSDSSESGSQVTRDNTNNQTRNYTYTKKGNQGVNTYAHDMIEYRKALIDIDMMIINSLQDLFLRIY